MSRRYNQYLGDGAYVYLDPDGSVVLYTSNGITETNTVVLEPAVLNSLELWLADTRRGEGER